MILTARVLNDVNSVNSFEYSTEMSMYEGDSATFYFQLADVSKNRAAKSFNPEGLRYMPTAPYSVSVSLLNIDDSKEIVRAAAQPFSEDPSIWSVPILSTDPLRGTVNVLVSVVENGVTTKALVLSAINVISLSIDC